MDCGCQGYEPGLENICDTCEHKVEFHARLTESAQGSQQSVPIFPSFPTLQSMAAATTSTSISANSRPRAVPVGSSTNTTGNSTNDTTTSSVRATDIASIAATVNRDISPYPINNFTQRLHERRFSPYPRGQGYHQSAIRDSPSPAGPQPLRYPYQCTVIILKEMHQ